MNFIQAIQSGFQNYVNFQGRARRSAYWWWALFLWILIGVPYYFTFQSLMAHHSGGIFGGVAGLIGLVLFLPSLGLSIRRLHDTGRSGWWLLIDFVPFIGAVVLLIFFCLPGTSGPNKYGDDPLGSPASGF